MMRLDPVDSVEVHILVDNVTDSLSSVPPFVETEFAGLGRRRQGQWVLSGSCLCCAAHGLSCLVTLRRGGETKTLLFDTGPEDRVFEQNVSRLGADLGAVEAIVLSHGHWDHGGAMLKALQIIRDHNGGRRVPYYAHPDMFRTRAMKRAGGSMRVMEDVPGIEALSLHGADVVNTSEAQALLGGMAHVSGEIPRITSFERGLPGQHRRSADGQGWELGELIMDERFVAAHVKGKGLVVFTACSHAGVINVLKHAKASFPDIRSMPWRAGFISPARMSGSSARRWRRCANSVSASSRPAIAPAGAPSPRLPMNSATRSWCRWLWASAIHSDRPP
jgi:7,8-dihydropterin-6-yl-methyl-4-(beta-D-ribofuranosyl)aminobenzene 5'-phosphate synthase